MNRVRGLPRAAWSSILRWTTLGTLGAVVLSLMIAEFILWTQGGSLNIRGVVISVALPLLLGAPLLFYHLLRLEQLRLANHKLEILASTDWLTTCLNRRAFTKLVQADLTGSRNGAFLVIDADHFKFINDHYGHHRGDEVLQLIASLIKANVREGDPVGRMGGEEFAVFLKGASPGVAEVVAERIRRAIHAAPFIADGVRHPLSVSVGGAVFDAHVSFTDIFRVADQHLYDAKQGGRNRIDLGPVAGRPSPLEAQAYG